ncbi:MAG: PD-(D/E)XK nuclease domain-containing protein, partial [Candidatus Aminicenantes bacterium]
FTESEVRGILQTLGLEKKIPLEDLRRYYDGYLFNMKAKERVYNPDMVLYYITRWRELEEPPGEIMDENVKTDYGRLQRLIANIKNKEQLLQVIREEKINATVVKRFSFELMYDQKYFTSLLFYMGFLTFLYEDRKLTYLGIPNYVIKTLFWEYFREQLHKEYTLEIDTSRIEKAISAMAFDGELGPFIDLVRGNVLSALSRRDYIKFDEKYIKVVLFSFLSLNPLYMLQSEPEVTGGFIDIYLERDSRSPEVVYEWLWELKYIKKEQSLEEVKAEGLEQLKRYAESRRFRGKENLKKALLIFRGKDECFVF